MDNPADHDRGLSLTSRPEHGGCTVAMLSGELDITSAPALREELLSLLSPAASRLIIDLSATGYADASGVAVLVGTPRQAARRVAAPGLTGTRGSQGLAGHRHRPAPRYLPHSPGRDPRQHPDARPATARAGTSRRAAPRPARARIGRARRRQRRAPHGHHRPPGARRRLARRRSPLPVHPALQALARASAGTSNAALIRAAQSLLSVLAREPLTHSPQVAATASRPGQPAGHRQGGDRPDAVDPRGERSGPGRVRGNLAQLVPHVLEPGSQGRLRCTQAVCSTRRSW
jgi:anti-anti-sigma factor